MALATLGCPASYNAVIHWRCGDYVFMPVENLTNIQFTRTLNDTATATITIIKDSLDDGCCGNLGKVEPWLHELTIYRDDDLVWQGPVMVVTETRTTVTIEAWDVSAWLGRLVNFSTRTYKNNQSDVTSMALYFIRYNLLDHAYSCTRTVDGRETDHACITPYITREDADVEPAYKPQEQSKYVLAVLEELVKFGLYWTTVGRRLILKGKPDNDDLPVATLNTDDFMGDVQVVRDGQSFATRAVATNGSSEEDRQTVSTGRSCSNPYGRVDWLVSSTDVPKCECDTSDDGPCADECEDNTSSAACKACVAACEDDCHAEQRAALLKMAQQELKGRYPVPVAIAVDNNAALSPEAGVDFSQLVPGYRFDVRFDRACRKIQQAFVLAQLQVTWDAGGEKVAIGLSPLDEPGVDEDEQQARAARARSVGAGAAAAWWERGELPAPPQEARDLAARGSTRNG